MPGSGGGANRDGAAATVAVAYGLAGLAAWGICKRAATRAALPRMPPPSAGGSVEDNDNNPALVVSAPGKVLVTGGYLILENHGRVSFCRRGSTRQCSGVPRGHKEWASQTPPIPTKMCCAVSLCAARSSFDSLLPGLQPPAIALQPQLSQPRCYPSLQCPTLTTRGASCLSTQQPVRTLR